MMSAQSNSDMHSAINRVLAAASDLYPDRARVASDSLHQILRGIRESEMGEAAWHSSALARTGFPLEFAFSSGDDSLRYTAEVTEPEIHPRQRLARAVALYKRLAKEQFPEDLSAFVQSVQSKGTLKYGAWISGRHGLANNSYKLYVEIPPESREEATAWTDSRLGREWSPLSNRRIRLCMLGHHGATGRTELYYDASYLRPGEIANLLDRAGLKTRANDVLQILQRAYDRPIGHRLPGNDFGFSYSLPAQGGPVAFSLYTFAISVFGGDAKIRTGLLRLASAQGWDFSLYEKMSEPLVYRRGFITCHTVFGVVVSELEPAAVVFGLTPPEVTA
jgi:hypothetical protein